MRKRKKWFLVICIVALLLLVSVPPMEINAKETLYTIDNITDDYAIEADVTINGYGVGYHAKLVLVTFPECAVSFGIQYDDDAWVPYKSRLALLFEDIYSNKHEPGEQVYYRPSDVQMEYGGTYHLMLTMNKKGVSNVYFNYQHVGTYENKLMKKKKLYPRVEAACKYNGDSVITEFSNIRVKDGDVTVTEAFKTSIMDTAPLIKSTIHDNTHITIAGVLSGLKPGEHWDSAYNAVSGVVQFDFD